MTAESFNHFLKLFSVFSPAIWIGALIIIGLFSALVLILASAYKDEEWQETLRGEDDVYLYAHSIIDKINLPRNVAKGDWSTLPISALWHMLENERKEVDEVIRLYLQGDKTIEDVEHELADEGAFLMMIHSILQRRKSNQ